MAKSKQQKQQEAIIRNRRHFESHRQTYLSYQVGGWKFHNFCATNRKEHAAIEAARQKVIFEKWCKSVGLDIHGNVI